MKTSVINIVFAAVVISVVFIGESFAISSLEQSNACSLNENNTPVDNRRKIRLGFTGPSTMHRQLLLTEDENATSGIDWGYDGAYYATPYDDMYWLIDGQLFTIQGIDVVDESSNFAIGFHTNEDGMNTIGIDALENFSEDFDLYLYDNELQVHHNLRDSEYEFYSDAGVFLNRFELVFADPQESSDALSLDENELDNFNIYYNSTSNTLVLNNPSSVKLKGLSIYNIASQLVHHHTLDEFSTRQTIRFNNKPANGTYIVMIETERGVVSQKVLLH
ncbi:T9SS type A sorting domain-containing protein [Winogradskyella sp.]|uniref:T9SS type A sorting domain-containing protein n=1 Tax=Winogradskyella sp. TaxID=1883156 RepID=UPI00351687AD